MLYRRPYHNTLQTAESLEILPPWMKMRREKSSVGWQYINALFGTEAEMIDKYTEEARKNSYLPSADPTDPCCIFRTAHNISQAPIGSVIAIEGSGEFPITEADDLYTFFEAPPTRVTVGTTTTFPSFSDTIIGFTFVVDYDPSGVWRMKDGNNHTAYVVNRDILATDYSEDETVVFADTDEQEIIRTYNFARGHQRFEDTGKDEILVFSSGSYTFDHVPIPSSLRVLDFLNLNSSGNAAEVRPEIFKLDEGRIDQVGYSAINAIPSGWSSSYLAE